MKITSFVKKIMIRRKWGFVGNVFIIILFIVSFAQHSTFARKIERTVNVKYFFPKDGTQNPSGDPNWFYYWSQALRLSNLSYNAGTNWGAAPFGKADNVNIGNNAGYGPDPRHSLTGIDCFFTVALHELRHRNDFIAIIERYGNCCGPYPDPSVDDPDGDLLPTFLDPHPNDVNGSGLSGYTGADAWRGDWEWRARQGEPNIAPTNIDWAHPGKQWP